MENYEKKISLSELLGLTWTTQAIEIFTIDIKGNVNRIYRGKNYGLDTIIKEYGIVPVNNQYARDDIIIIKIG